MTYFSNLEIKLLSSDAARAKLLLFLIKRESINSFLVKSSSFIKSYKIKFLETLGVSFEFQASPVRSIIFFFQFESFDFCQPGSAQSNESQTVTNSVPI